ncbi:hypothetical protein H8B01_38240, partial [Bradyrhizobium sp. Cham227]|nr:hypothetical protein [Bradyrhizobium brasilense]
EDTAEGDRAQRRRSTVREKVNFASSPQPEASAALVQSPAEEATPEPAAAAPEPAPAAAAEAPARKGWWSRRFGGGN